MEKVGIIIATQEEKEEMEKIIEDMTIKEILGIRFMLGKIENKKVIAAESGVGKVNAGRVTQIMCNNFKVTKIINVGVAGSLNPKLEIGDVVVAKRVVQHDFDITAFGHSKGYIPKVGNNVECDRDSISKLETVIKDLPEKQYKIVTGVIATGDIFITSVVMKDKIRSKFNADVVEMECGAVAQVSYLNGIPFMAIRSVSDTPDGRNAGIYENNAKLAAKHACSVLREYLKI